jgi:hypothetical protein
MKTFMTCYCFYQVEPEEPDSLGIIGFSLHRRHRALTLILTLAGATPF